MDKIICIIGFKVGLLSSIALAGDLLNHAFTSGTIDTLVITKYKMALIAKSVESPTGIQSCLVK